MKNILVILGIFIFQLSSPLLESAYSQEMNPAQIMEKFGNAVVLIATITNNQEIGQGSGFIVKNDGVIVTNYHVIEHAYPALIKLKNGDIYEEVGVIDYNEREDIAVIKIKGFDLPVVRLGNSNDIKVGEKIVVIGNPNGLENTISDGLLSQIRDTGKGYKLHQISAPISPGSSGSPIFNSKGEVVSIASSGFSAEYGQNLNFAIPINYVRAMIEGEVKHTLKEFSGMEKEKSIIKTEEINEEVDIKKMLKILNESLSVLLMAIERTPIYYNAMSKSYGERGKLFIPNEFYGIREKLRIAKGNLTKHFSSDKELEEMRRKLNDNADEAYKCMSEMIDALEKAEVEPAKPQYVHEAREMGARMAASLQLESEFWFRLLERIRQDVPDLEKEIYHALVWEYDNKDKSEEETEKERNKGGVMGCDFYVFSETPQCKAVIKGSPADKAGIKVNDKILGVEKGIRFSSMKDCFDFRNKTSPGETYTFKVERDGEILTKKVKLGKYEDYR